ncbi:MAG: hypothetical protein M1830_004838 [Pleopsidium flavum]|nr:MAG: hypothetical protein M1830_004838 [Pleopsidium flavum]
MDASLSVSQISYILSASSFILLKAFAADVRLAAIYLTFLVAYALRCYISTSFRRRTANMHTSPLFWLTLFGCYTVSLTPFARAQSPDVDTTSISSGGAIGRTSAAQLPSASSSAAMVVVNGTTTSFRPIFTVPAEAAVGATLIPNIDDPKAVDPQMVCPGYTGFNVVRTPIGLTATLKLAGNACNVYGTDIDTLNLTVEYQSNDRLSVKIIPAVIDSSNMSHYILPDRLVHEPTLDGEAKVESLTNELGFYWSNEPTFSFTVIRRNTGDVLFTTEGSKLVFENQFIEFASPLPENYNLNIYGSHPFYLETRYFEVDATTGNLTLVTGNSSTQNDYISYSHGVYLRNAHGQEILLRPENITWRTIGGSIDLYFFAGPTQQEVTAAYQKGAIGLPVMQQYFTFGYHQCRWGYANWSQVEEVVMNYEKFGIPLESIWTDIDYMNQYRDFDNDAIRYNYTTGQEFLARLHASGRHYIPIVDSAIYVPNPNNASDAYPTFDRGNATNSFMTNPDGSLYIGDVWPGYTVFPDWLAPGAGNWWTNEMIIWHGEIGFDGIWIDMSEVSSFIIGSVGESNITMNPVHPPFKLPGEPGAIIYDYPENFNVSNATEAASASSGSASQAAATSSGGGSSSPTTPNYLRTSPTPGVRNINYPPYVINNVQGDLANHAVSPNATHADGTQEYDVHNLFGHEILNATYNALLSVFPGKRPFIIGRSTFAGSGMFAGHWGGDNYSKWAYMFFSIPQALSFSLFGIPMFGVDTCGFNGSSDEELCNRWMQLSAFFPFYRNHNTLSAISQEAYVWASVIDATKRQ